MNISLTKTVFIFSVLSFCFQTFTLAQEATRSFELRYFTNDAKANGETDFKGETEYLTTEQRVDFLKQYADYASRFFNDPELNTKVVEDEEVQSAVAKIKPQPQPSVRNRMALDEWQWLGYKKGQHTESALKLARWQQQPEVSIEEGKLVFTNDNRIKFTFPSQSWRFSLEWKAKAPDSKTPVKFILSDKEKVKGTTIGFGENGKIFYYTANGEKVESTAYEAGAWYDFKVEFDLAAKVRKEDVVRYNLYVNGEKIADYVPSQRVITEGVGYAQNFTSVSFINTFSVEGPAGTALDDIWGVGYHATGRDSYPYTVETFLDENFEIKPDIAGWENRYYQDSSWQTGKLPLVHGSERYAEEDLYLRKEISLENFEKAYLNIETLDPGGEIWVNGKIAGVVTDRHPVKLDITSFLNRNEKNIIALKVNHFYLTESVGELMPHSSLDMNVGWFAGRAWLDLTGATTLEQLYVHTESLGSQSAKLKLRMDINHQGPLSFRGKAEVKLYPWFPEESATAVVTETIPVVIGHGKVQFEHTFDVLNPNLWSPGNPQLYKVEVTLKDDDGQAVDDAVNTTGIRTLSQKNGTFHLNGKPSMLNGAQIMGFRGPIENMVKWVKCPPAEWLAREILMVKKMHGNLVRVHVHAWEFPSGNINDPRLPEMADQMGMMLIWGTPAWVRTGSGWGQIDFEGLPKYIKQVYNHPSIAVWEAANHTQSFKGRDVMESNLFCEKVYNTIYPLDPSRLISFNSYVRHLHYGNDEGTIDQLGNPITPSPAWTAPMVTRGNQDGITGYSRNWTTLRKWPDAYIKSFLESDERAYFNFEHEESMGQPNWNLMKGKPWYRLHSYEHVYDEGTIGRKLTLEEWKESQGWQSFSAWESMKKQRLLDYDGFSWCCLHGGANSVTYKKPIIDFLGHAKLSFWVNKMIFQPTVAGSDNVDVVLGPADAIRPAIAHWGDDKEAQVKVIVKNAEGQVIDEKTYNNVKLEGERKSITLQDFTPDFPEEGYYFIEYEVR